MVPFAYKLLEEADLTSAWAFCPEPNERLVHLAPVNKLYDLLTIFITVLSDVTKQPSHVTYLDLMLHKQGPIQLHK